MGGARVRQIPSPCGVGGEAGYTAQEDLKSMNSYNMGEGRTIRAWSFCSCIPSPTLVSSAFWSLGPHNLHLFYIKYISSIATCTSIPLAHKTSVDLKHGSLRANCVNGECSENQEGFRYLNS